MTSGFSRISTYDLEVLNAVAETGSFHRAAKRLHVGQSAVSRRVQNLENLLGVSLFERSTKGATLTVAGRRFARSSRTVLEEIDRAVSEAQSAGIGLNGCLRIGSTLSFSNGAERRLVQNFLRKHPETDLSFLEATRRELLTMLSHREVDVLFSSCAPIDENGDGLVLDHEEMVLAVPCDSAFAQEKRVAWKKIGDETFLVSKRDSGPDIFRFLSAKLRKNGALAHMRHVDLSREALMVLVGLGEGVSVVGAHARGVQYPNVKFIPVGNADERIPFSLTWRPGNDNPSLRRFVSLARIEARRNGALS